MTMSLAVVQKAVLFEAAPGKPGIVDTITSMISMMVMVMMMSMMMPMMEEIE